MYYLCITTADFHTMSSWEKPVVTADCMACKEGKLIFKPFL